jgi:colanic acid biosynthesis protein WcaH
MDVHDEHIPEETFATCLQHLPQVCVDLVVEVDDGVVLGRRTNEPAKGEWFWPGGRIYKGESLDNAARRVAREELGFEPDELERLGVSEHFWERSAVTGLDERHTVPIVYHVTGPVSLDLLSLDDQHDEYRILREPESDHHRYVAEYLDRFDLLNTG